MYIILICEWEPVVNFLRWTVLFVPSPTKVELKRENHQLSCWSLLRPWSSAPKTGAHGGRGQTYSSMDVTPQRWMYSSKE